MKSMQIFRKHFILFIPFLLFISGCVSQRESKIEKDDADECNIRDLKITYNDGCNHLSWECNNKNTHSFTITRYLDIENVIGGKKSYVTDTQTFIDCDILAGLTYTYEVVDSGDESKKIKKTIEIKAEQDFDYSITSEVKAGIKLEFELNYNPTTPNPYDMERLKIEAEIIKPDGTRIIQDGFFMREFKINEDASGDEEFIRGENKIKVRYTPDIKGTYIVRFNINEDKRDLYSGYYPIQIDSEDLSGYIRISSKNHLYFEDESKKLFYPIGFNIGWTGKNGIFEFEYYMDRMAENNANLFRMWMIKWSNAIEWTKGNGAGDYDGLMHYAQDNAARIDRIFAYAEEKDIKIMLTLGSYLEFTEGGRWNEGSWNENPYNIKNGGMCNYSQDFFTDEEAKRFYKNRLRYIAARWGYSRSLFAYEFFNETYAPFVWVSEMSAFLKKVDNGRHLVSTTYGDDRIYNLKNIDFTMAHLYGNPPDLILDYPQRVADITREFTAKYKKPFILAEFGLDFTKSDAEYDPQGTGTNMHNGIFTSISNGASGTAMMWWWDDYIEKYNLYKILKPVKIIIDELGDFVNMSGISEDDISIQSDRVNVYGIYNTDTLLLLIQNKEFNWYNIYNEIEIIPVSPLEITLNLANLNCSGVLKYIDSMSGEVIDSQNISINKSLILTTPEIQKDLVIIFRCN